MTESERTAGFQDRIKTQLEEGPRPMSVRGLAAGLRAVYPELRGTSDSGIRHYIEGDVKKLRLDLVRAMADILGLRWEWLAFKDGLPTVQQEDQAVIARNMGPTKDSDGGDPFTAAALDGLMETLPLGAHLTFEWRGLSGTAIKLAQALQPRSQHEEKETDAEKKHVRELAIAYHLEAGRLLGECIAKPLEMLGASISEKFIARAYIGAAAHAIDIIVHYATVKVDDAPGATEETDDA